MYTMREVFFYRVNYDYSSICLRPIVVMTGTPDLNSEEKPNFGFFHFLNVSVGWNIAHTARTL